MAGPATPLIIGAGIGAMVDQDNPMRGAALGAGAGYFGPMALNAATAPAAAQASSALAGTSGSLAAQAALSPSASGLMAVNSSALGNMAGPGASLAMQAGNPMAINSAALGSMPGSASSLASTGATAATPMGIQTAYNAPPTKSIMDNPSFMMGNMMRQQEQPQQQQAPMAMPRQIQPYQGSFNAPYQRQDPRMYTQPMSTLARFRGGNYGF
jgi:hypothetical protein